MDNDNKIKAKSLAGAHEEVQLFLKDELKSLSYSKAAQYNLEQEYARTKKNKNRAVVIIIASCFFAVALLTLGLSLFIRSSNNSITVNIDTFDDLNLRTLLNSAGRAEDLYQNAVRYRDNLIASRDEELTAAEQKRENDLYTLQSVAKVSSKKAIEEKRTAIQAQYKKSVEEIKAKYSVKIAEAEKQISEREGFLSGFDAERLSEAQKNEAALDSQKQLNDMEKADLEKRYLNQIQELKIQMAVQQREAVKQQREAVEEVRRIYQAKIDLLDPDARSQSQVQDKIILETGIPKSATSNASIEFKQHFDGDYYVKQFEAPEENFVSSINTSSVYLEDLNTIANRFSTIPMENSIRHYVPAMQRLAYQIVENMAQSQSTMQKKIDVLKNDVKQKNSRLDTMGKYFDAQCTQDRANPADGIIINSQNKKEIFVHVASSKQSLFTENQTLNAQIREGKKMICQISISKDGDGWKVVPSEEAKSSEIDQIKSGQKFWFVMAAKK